MTWRPFAVLAGVVVLGCRSEARARASRLHDGLASASRAPIGAAVRLDFLAPFAWDTAWVFGPYDGLGGREAAHPAAAAAAQTGIADRDDINAVVLMRGVDPVAVVAQERAAGDFALGGGAARLPRAGAVLRVCRVSGDRSATFATGDGRTPPLDGLARSGLTWRCR